MKRLIFLLFWCFIVPFALNGQTMVDELEFAPTFTTPDTVCVGAPITIVNPIIGSTFYWNFCTGNAANPPVGASLGNVNANLSAPRFVTLVRDNLNCYSFVTSSTNSCIVRNFHGDSFRNAPLTSDKLVGSIFTSEIQGIQVLQDQGNWYGFIANGNVLVKLSFGASLMNPPAAIDIPFSTINKPTGLVIAKDLANWVGYALDYQNNQLSKLNFGTSLNSSPTVTSLGNIGNLNGPTGMILKRISGFWYIFISNEKDNTLTRLDFMNSLSNTPTGINLGNVGGLDHPTGITLINDCQSIQGYVVNHTASSNTLVHLAFPDGVNGGVTGTVIPGVNSLNSPYGISEMVRAGDTIYMYATNDGNSTLSKLYFPVCGASSIPSYSGGSTPPTFSYSAPGIYNVILSVNEGLPTASTSCNKIVVVEPLDVDLGPDQQICDGSSTTLSVDTGYIYLWSNGNTTNSISVTTAGTYWVNVTNSTGCASYDTINVGVVQGFVETVNRQICDGERYYAQGAWQTTTGLFVDSLTSVAGCDSLVYTNLYVNPPIQVDLGRDTMYCPGTHFVLDATTATASAYLWQDGSTLPTYDVDQAGTYWVEVTVNNCLGGDTIQFSNCPSQMWFPTAFTPNNDGLNDYFKPTGVLIANYHLLIFDRWGTQVFESKVISEGWDGKYQGEYCEPGVYAYTAVYETLEPANETKKVSGSLTLMR